MWRIENSLYFITCIIVWFISNKAYFICDELTLWFLADTWFWWGFSKYSRRQTNMNKVERYTYYFQAMTLIKLYHCIVTCTKHWEISPNVKIIFNLCLVYVSTVVMSSLWYTVITRINIVFIYCLHWVPIC